ncbi:MAG: hydrolase [Actinobacteria bacterium]|nr:hydrolase [Actinomycetota bacterium]
MNEMGKRCESGKLIVRDDCLLLVVDIQEKLIPFISENEMVVGNTLKLLKFAKIIGIPAIVTEQEKLGPTVEALKSEMDGLEPIMKLDFSACRCGEFRDAVDRTGKTTLIVTGIESHICITQTVLQMIPDYNVHVVSDAVSSRTLENREVALDRMRDAGAVITSTEMLMYELLVKAGTDEFKETLPLVK